MYFILGQGLAGTALAFRFLQENIPFKIFDNKLKSSSSIVAAGLWNPIVFKRITKSWMAVELLEELNTFYPEIEKILGVSFFHSSYNVRMHSSLHEENDWAKKMNEPEFENFLSKPYNIQKLEKHLNPRFGFGNVSQTGNIDLTIFLKSASDFFIKKRLLTYIEIDLPDTADKLETFEINGLRPDKIIDCRGAVSRNSSWWNYLPFKPAKGEILTIKCPGLDLEKTLNAGIFILPLGDDVYKIGSTFSWENLDSIPSEIGRKEIAEKFEKLVKLPYQITEHQAGIRPSIADRRPVLGSHPACEKLVLFNGLGTKGVMLAPYFSKELLEHLIRGKAINSAAHLNRFNKRHRKSLETLGK